jgi:hypothetical protein
MATERDLIEKYQNERPGLRRGASLTPSQGTRFEQTFASP